MKKCIHSRNFESLLYARSYILDILRDPRMHGPCSPKPGILNKVREKKSIGEKTFIENFSKL